MNTRVLATIILFVLAVALSACAEQYGQHPATAKNVQEVLDHPVDDMKVTLRGQIVERVGDDDYTFSDNTGQIVVDIDDDKLPEGNAITPGTEVEIYGEVEAKMFKTPHIDVKRVKLIPPGEIPGTDGAPAP